MSSKKAEALASEKIKKDSMLLETWRRVIKNPGALFGLILLGIIILAMIYSFIFIDFEQVTVMNVLNRFKTPCLEHPFGTDEFGRDILLRVLYGSRYSIAVAFGAVGFGLIGGMFLGGIAGFAGGRIEDILMRVTDVLASIPGLLLGMVIVTLLGPGVINLLLAIGLSSVPMFSRMTRAAVLTVKGNEYVEAARAIGMSPFKILYTQVLPNCTSPLIVAATSRMASAVLSAAALSFLGFGVAMPTPEWGALISAGRNFMMVAPHITFFPGLFIMITVLACNLLGDGLRDALDPKLKR